MPAAPRVVAGLDHAEPGLLEDVADHRAHRLVILDQHDRTLERRPELVAGVERLVGPGLAKPVAGCRRRAGRRQPDRERRALATSLATSIRPCERATTA